MHQSLIKVLPSSIWLSFKIVHVIFSLCVEVSHWPCHRLILHTVKVVEGNVLFNDTLNTFYLQLYGVGHMVKDHSDSEREETHSRHMGYSFRLTARVLLYAPSHRQDSTYHSLCYSSRGALAGTRNSSMGPP